MPKLTERRKKNVEKAKEIAISLKMQGYVNSDIAEILNRKTPWIEKTFYREKKLSTAKY